MYDIIIVGGGPSGSSACRKAARLGLKTLLIEKNKFPRYKACGGALSEQAISYLDFNIPEFIHERDVFGARVHYKGRVIERHKDYRIATLVSRNLLDDFLINKAKESGAEIIFEQKVIDIKENSDEVKVYTNETSFKCKYLVIAEGAHGVLKYKIRRRDKKNEYGICVVTEIPEKNDVIDKYILNAIDIHFGVANLGYGWIFPHEKYFSVGIGGSAQYLTEPKKVMIEFLKKNGFQINVDMKVHLIPAGGVYRRLSSERVILSGDSAGFVDSFYGEGISYAIRSGQIAVTVINDKLKNNNLNISFEYRNHCQKEFGKNLNYSLKLSKLMHQFPNVFFKIFTNNDIVIDKFLEVPAVKNTYKNYMKWILLRLPVLLFSNK